MSVSTPLGIARALSVTAAAALFAVGFVMATPADANAAACAHGPYRTACRGPHGAVAAPHGYATMAHRVRCYYRRGVRVCR